MLDILLNITQGIDTAINTYKNISGVFKGDPKKQCLEQISDHLGGIRDQMERLSDHIIYAPKLQIVQDINQSRQRYVDNLREVRECLEPVQQALGGEILSSAMILTPAPMQKAMAINPWEMLTDIRPVNLAVFPTDANRVPVLFNHNGVQYLGWQWRETLPVSFEYTPMVAPQNKQVFEFEQVRLNARGEITQRSRGSATQQTEWINGVALEMVTIPGGTYLMGTEDGQSETPQHRVTIAPFEMSKYPITQKQWQAVMGSNPSYFKGENRPVESITWHEAVEYCAILSENTGKIYRLPSEAQWEYACRAGTKTPFYFGETIMLTIANYDGNYTYGSTPKGVCREETSEVGRFPANAFGLYDMHGNIWEWCADPWHDKIGVF
ncbi:serine/threonine protein kinase [Candidatus Thiomargarita nelsonii]|uniref:Serine/threonine protein kinase n=1 Tax=Candidatus Thiomargarita nelsonii TaxID=1003181 RepID=A0A176RUD3_9GAMM|nr:serine/threonine protein kinase [Candidatus Thiomargarita nelsonii]